jgi:hypothetical protein
MTPPPASRAGVLVIRVWAEGDDPATALRARLVGRHDVAGEDPGQLDDPVGTAASIDEVVAQTRRWLEQFAATIVSD